MLDVFQRFLYNRKRPDAIGEIHQGIFLLHLSANAKILTQASDRLKAVFELQVEAFNDLHHHSHQEIQLTCQNDAINDNRIKHNYHAVLRQKKSKKKEV